MGQKKEKPALSGWFRGKTFRSEWGLAGGDRAAVLRLRVVRAGDGDPMARRDAVAGGAHGVAAPGGDRAVMAGAARVAQPAARVGRAALSAGMAGVTGTVSDGGAGPARPPSAVVDGAHPGGAFADRRPGDQDLRQL